MRRWSKSRKFDFFKVCVNLIEEKIQFFEGLHIQVHITYWETIWLSNHIYVLFVCILTSWSVLSFLCTVTHKNKHTIYMYIVYILYRKENATRPCYNTQHYFRSWVLEKTVYHYGLRTSCYSACFYIEKWTNVIFIDA